MRRTKEVESEVRDRIRDNPEIADSGVELPARERGAKGSR
jgi:hypothetical protein